MWPVWGMGRDMSGWLGTKYKSIDEMRALRDAGLWYWMLRTRAYPLLEEVYGYEFGGETRSEKKRSPRT
jgi:hypothetical protein